MTSVQDKVTQSLQAGGIPECIKVLDEMIPTESGDELLDVCCMRASFGAMHGEAKDLAQRVMKNTSDDSAYARACASFVEGTACLASNTGFYSAKNAFQDALSADPNFVFAQIGLAATELLLKDYRAAFAAYKICLEKLGTAAPAMVRVGLAVCSYHLKKIDHALKCLDRALAVEPDNELALMAKVVIHLHRREFPSVIPCILTLYRIAPENPVIAQRFADVLFLKAAATGQVQSNTPLILDIVRRATATTDNQGIKGYAKFQEARISFANGDLDDARRLYEEALVALPSLYAARVQLARLEYSDGAQDRAVSLLEQLLREMPFERESLKMMALHSASTGHHSHAITLSKRLSRAAAPGDPASFSISAWCNRLDKDAMNKELQLQARLLQQINPEKPLPVTTRSNMAALGGDLDTLSACVVEMLGKNWLKAKDIPVDALPLLYNLANTHVDRGNADDARNIYKMLVKNHPTFVGSYHQLAELGMSEKDFDSARRWLNLLDVAAPGDSFTLVYRARMLLEEGKNTEAAKLLVQSGDRSVPVAIAAGKVYLQGAQFRTTKAAQHLNVARDRFAFALSKDSGNILAAHGIGCCTALVADPNIGQVCLEQVAETIPNDKHVHHNMPGHRFNMYVKCGLHKLATSLFQAAPNKTVAQTCALAYCLAKDGAYKTALDIMRASTETEPVIQYNLILALWLNILYVAANESFISEDEGRRLKDNLHEVVNRSKEFINGPGLPEIREQANRFVKRVVRQARSVQSQIAQLIARGRKETVRQTQESAAWQRGMQRQMEEVEERRQQRVEAESRKRDVLSERTEEQYRKLVQLRERWESGLGNAEDDGDDVMMPAGEEDLLGALMGTDDNGAGTTQENDLKRKRDDEDLDDGFMGAEMPVSTDDLVAAMAVPADPADIAIDETLLVDGTLAVPEEE